LKSRAKSRALVAGVLVLAGCGVAADLPPSTGSVDAQFIVGSSLSQAIDHFDYRVTGGGLPLGAATLSGTVRLGDPGASVSAAVGGLPSGQDYHLLLSAITEDQGTFCSGDAVFGVAAPAHTALDVSLVCINAGTIRTVQVAGAAHVCPVIGSTAVSRAGGITTLSASAFSFDDSSLTFSWEAPAGRLATPQRAVSSYACGPPGARELRVTVTDGSCADVGLLDVSCAPSTL
jgi:hypothetical protein